jgi:hypothetical protein
MSSKKRIGTIVVLAALVVTTGFMIYAAGPWTGQSAQSASSSGWFLVLMVAWAALPYLGALLLVHKSRGLPTLFSVAAAIVICLAGPGLVVAALAGAGGAQAGLGFVVLPFLQWMGLGAVGIASIVGSRMRAT